jgi:diguanylate cyclase (GGDEF)-like protein
LISLRESIDLDLEKALQSTLASYRAALVAVGDAGAHACPPAAESLKESLLNLSQRLSSSVSSSLVAETEQCVEQELKAWGEHASHYYQEKTDEMKELLLLVAKAASEVGERDQRYAKQFGDLAGRLHGAARLNDLSAMRQSLGRHAAELKVCVTQMTRDGRDSISQLRAQLATYEARLEQVERIACLDQLTGIANRHKVEHELELRLKKGLPFSVVYLDINDFKRVNDTFGHLAGDDLLKQFAGELRMAFRSTDLIGRWGGDEFIVLVDGRFQEAESRIERIEQWVNGEYALPANDGPRKVIVSAATGIAAWETGDTATSLLQRADTEMYRHKARAANRP